jgi:hypothetical protein
MVHRTPVERQREAAYQLKIGGTAVLHLRATLV